jgi:hypothetical protein
MIFVLDFKTAFYILAFMEMFIKLRIDVEKRRCKCP